MKELIEVIDQYGERHRFPSPHFIDAYPDRVEVMLEENDELRCVATFPHPAAFGEVRDDSLLVIREIPHGVARMMREQAKQIEELAAALAEKDARMRELNSAMQERASCVSYRAVLAEALAIQPHASLVAKIKADAVREFATSAMPTKALEVFAMNYADRIEREEG